MSSKRTNWTETLIAVGQTGFGIVLATAPVTLWLAWSPLVFLVVVVAIGVSAGIFILLHDFEHLVAEARLDAPGRRSGYLLPEEFVDELHRIYPLTYHHSLQPRARFRRAMKKLRRLAY